jgi:L-ascorbate metabolism protein UlaG (beta-lactamase superfamily)
MIQNDISRFTPKSGQLAFWWLGQLGYIVKTQSATVCFDPFLSPSPTRLVAPTIAPELLNADFVFGSHDHADHIDYDAWKIIAKTSPSTRFVLPGIHLERLSELLSIPRERMIPLQAGEEYLASERNLRIRAFPAAHEFLDPGCLGYHVTMDSLSVCHTGDTCKYDGLEPFLKTLDLDLLFLPINGRDAKRYTSGCIGNMNFAEAVDLAGVVAPKLAIPGHYEMFANNSENPLKFSEYLEVKYPSQNYWIGAHGTQVIFQRAILARD